MRHLWLGFVLIAATSSVLLISDLGQRHPAGSLPRVALVQHASQSALDEGVQGILEGLNARGYIDGRTMSLQRFNAENDLVTANAIAKQVVGGGFDLIITASTLSTQTVANANQAGRTRHVFGIVADPLHAGIGINPDNPAEHPAYLTGVGSLIPVDKAFELAREMNPGLTRVGLVWNTAESNSAAFTEAARAISKQLAIELLEANAENSSSVGEAAASLTARGAQALFISGDVTILVATDAVVSAGNRARIPTFSIIPPNVEKGTLFDLGANFVEVGREVGNMAADVLDGANPADIPVVNSVPERLAINTTALEGLRDRWNISDDLLARADLLIDASGIHDRSTPATTTAEPPGTTYRMGLVYFAPEAGSDLTIQGLLDGLSEAGIEEGKNLEIQRSHAQGEIANIPALLQNYDSQGLDLIVTLTTPCLTAACTVVRKTPVVFTYVYDPIAAGAGTTREDHLPSVTGVGSFPPVGDTIDLIQKLVPGVTSVGTIYNSSEANSRKVIGVGRDMFAERGIDLEEVTVTGTSEILQAAQVVSARGVQALWVTGDNTALQGFDAIVNAAKAAKLPLIINDPEFVENGALAAVGLGWYQAGHTAGGVAARVLRGEDPADIPFQEVAVQQLLLNQDVARELGITFPPDVLAEAAQ